MKKFVVAETIHCFHVIQADDAKSAIAARKRGEGEMLREQSASYIARLFSEADERDKPVPESEWPKWAKAIRQFSKPSDKGIGDVVARMIGDENSEAFKAWHLATFGRACGCTGRQQRLNRTYPL